MASATHPPNMKETRTIEIDLTKELQDRLNNQSEIQSEMKYNVTEIPYNEYIERMKLMDGGNTNITNQLLKQLFETHPEFDRIKDTLILSTFRTSLTTDSGLNGETFFHRDNILFPNEKDSYLIITWGLGTQAATIDLTQLVEGVRQKIIKEKNTDWESFFTFKRRMLADPSKTIRPYKSIDASNPFNKIVKETYDTIIGGREKLNLDILISSSPNVYGNITALIISGKEAYHRRITTEKIRAKPIYRYVLNIYFNAEDLQPVKTPGGKKKRGSTQKKRTNRRHRKTR